VPSERAARIVRVQAASGLVFAFFLTLHLATTASGVAGPVAYDGTLALLRRAYRPVLAVEIALIGIPALVHVACAVLQIVERRRRGVPAGSPLAHRLAGYVLLAAIGGHVFATRVMPAFGDGPADFSYLAYSLLNWPLFMQPYYLVLGVAGAVHLTLGVTIAVRVLGLARPAHTRALAAAAVLAVVVAAGTLGILAGADEASRDRFAGFRALYERFMPFLPPRL
jgi:succinate dehydrogenase/fumarate reductase cytochrome b subunit